MNLGRCGLPFVGTGECAGLCPEHCVVGQRRNKHLTGLALMDKLTSEHVLKAHVAAEEHNHEIHGTYKPASKSHAGNGVYKGAYAFTLTKSPTDDLTEKDMVEAVKKVMNQKSCSVKKYAWYMEYKDYEMKTHPHIHGMYETHKSGRIEKKHWVRAWPIWDEGNKLGAGFRGGYHREVRSNEGYSDYIKKDKNQGLPCGQSGVDEISDDSIDAET